MKTAGVQIRSSFRLKKLAVRGYEDLHMPSQQRGERFQLNLTVQRSDIVSEEYFADGEVCPLNVLQRFVTFAKSCSNSFSCVQVVPIAARRTPRQKRTRVSFTSVSCCFFQGNVSIGTAAPADCRRGRFRSLAARKPEGTRCQRQCPYES